FGDLSALGWPLIITPYINVLQKTNETDIKLNRKFGLDKELFDRQKSRDLTPILLPRGGADPLSCLPIALTTPYTPHRMALK
ncbi:MAG: hypothetical protein MJA27_16690, partial [Pseudanabaenales cyanobacterium]|nr:hypothetical protein [Pseudanabaenales cyanobacterium]